MKNGAIKNRDQVIFFEKIKKNLPANHSLVDVISELLNVGIEASYRRIRGTKLLDFKEMMILCRHFRLSFDPGINSNNNQFQCLYIPLDLTDLNNYLIFIQSIYTRLENFHLMPGSEIILSAIDIPLFHMLSYKELTYFKLFSWGKSVYGFPKGYEEFVNEIDAFELHKRYHEKIVRYYQNIPSSEIWTDDTISSILRMLVYHFDMKHFMDNKIPLFICEQLLEMIEKLQIWAENGSKGDKAFKIYFSEISSGSTCILFKNAETSNCLVRLFTINGLIIDDQKFCHETEYWLKNLSNKATLISESSERERFNYFNKQKQRVKLLMNTIKQQI